MIETQEKNRIESERQEEEAKKEASWKQDANFLIFLSLVQQ